MADFTFALQRLLNKPLACTDKHAAMIVAAVRSRLGFTSLQLGERTMDVADMDVLSAMGRHMAAESVQRRQARSKIYEQGGPVAIIPVHGTLTKTQEAMDPESGMTGYNRVEQKLDAAMQDDQIKGIWLDVDSGGGEFGGMVSTARFIRDRCAEAGGAAGAKPVWAMCAPYAYSAAYMLASAADRVVCSIDGGAGSVGVLCLHSDYTQYLENEGIKITVLRSGKRKARGNPYEVLDPETRDHIQGQMDESYDLFCETVAEFRGMSKEAVVETQADDYNPRPARAIGFVDDVLPEHVAFEEFLRKFR